jgi:hypothetical protein
MASDLSMLRYTVDRFGLIVDVEVAHHHLSLTDDDFPLLPMSVVGSLLCDHITGQETQEFTADLLEKVRVLARPLRIPYRCDALSAKRFCQMVLTPQDAGAIAIAHILIKEEPLPIRLRFEASPATDSVRCSMCNQVRHNDVWREPEVAFAANLLRREHANIVIYKICPGCRRNALGFVA